MNCVLPLLVFVSGLYLNPCEIVFKQTVRDGCLIVKSGTRPPLLIKTDCKTVDKAIKVQLKNFRGRIDGKIIGR